MYPVAEQDCGGCSENIPPHTIRQQDRLINLEPGWSLMTLKAAIVDQSTKDTSTLLIIFCGVLIYLCISGHRGDRTLLCAVHERFRFLVSATLSKDRWICVLNCRWAKRLSSLRAETSFLMKKQLMKCTWLQTHCVFSWEKLQNKLLKQLDVNPKFPRSLGSTPANQVSVGATPDSE